MIEKKQNIIICSIKCAVCVKIVLAVANDNLIIKTNWQNALNQNNMSAIEY